MSDIPVPLTIVKEWLQQINPDEQSIPYSADTWRKQFTGDSDVEAIIARYPHQLTRRDVAELAREAHEEGGDVAAVRRLFLAAMIWGYGTVWHGAYRTKNMINDAHADEVLPRTFALVLAGKLIDAYNEFQLDRCGPAFFTRYFYFIGLGCHLHPMPVILDSVVANSLEVLLHLDITEVARVTRNEQGIISAIHPDAEGHERYVQWMNA